MNQQYPWVRSVHSFIFLESTAFSSHLPTLFIASDFLSIFFPFYLYGIKAFSFVHAAAILSVCFEEKILIAKTKTKQAITIAGDFLANF